jgi:hypothetical protein
MKALGIAPKEWIAKAISEAHSEGQLKRTRAARSEGLVKPRAWLAEGSWIGDVVPCKRKIFSSRIDALCPKIHRVRVQREQYTVAAARKAAELVNLFKDRERRLEVRCRRMPRVLHVDGHRLDPRMAVEPRADQISVGGPSVQRVGRAVSPSESLAAADEVEQVIFLVIRNRQLAAGEKQDCVVGAQRSCVQYRNVFGLGPDNSSCVPSS